MRIGESRYRWEFRLLDGETADDFGTLAALRPLIAPWTRDVCDGELTLLRVAQYTFRAQIADRWRRGNIFILGDAAHLTPPFIGQGMGAGLRDAMNLCWKIAAVRDGVLAPDHLDSYQQERKPHARQLIRLALNIGWSMPGAGRLGDLARRAVLPRLGLIPGLRDKIVDSATPAVRRSALVHRSRWRRGLSGSLCPNPLLSNGQRFDDAMGPGFTLVSLAALAANDEALLRQHKVTVIRAEPHSQQGSWLRGGRATCALVRPDGTVMRAGRDVSAVCQRLRTICRVPGVTQPAPQRCR
jgi:3-(3-hydroxy-phenyl)propionate hydroxylase